MFDDCYCVCVCDDDVLIRDDDFDDFVVCDVFDDDV